AAAQVVAARRGRRARPLSHPQARGCGTVQRARELHLHDTAPPVGRLDHLLDGLGALVEGRVRLWRSDGSGLHLAAGEDPGWSLPAPARPGLGRTPGGLAWLEPVAGPPGLWLEVAGQD